VQRITRTLFYTLIFPATLGFGVWQGWSWWSWAIAPPLDIPDAIAPSVRVPNLRLDVAPGTSARQIGDDLHAVGLIRSTTAWSLWTRLQTLTNRPGGFQAGTYELSPADPMPAIANRIWAGEVVTQQFTIPEGWTIQQMAGYFESLGLFSADEFIDATRTIPYSAYPWLPHDLPHLEGFLFPDTYSIQDSVTPDGIIRQMLSGFETVALPMYQQRASSYTLLEWVTLASIVEREAVVGQERPLIASVFARRLREEMPLGADPTVEYALGIQQTPERPLTLAEVRTPSPYNTYINPGLPPTPISSPGRASLEVSLAPGETDYLYFVARYDGTHVFSRTLAEHEAAQARIRDDIDGRALGGSATP
jgi:UPF0755 protein